MAVYNKAYELARMISESDEYKAYCEARAEVEKDSGAVWVLKDFRRRQMQIEMAQVAGQKTSDDEMKKYQQLVATVSLHGPVTRFLAAEMRLLQMMADVQRILGDNIKLWDYLELETPRAKEKPSAEEKPPTEQKSAAEEKQQ